MVMSSILVRFSPLNIHIYERKQTKTCTATCWHSVSEHRNEMCFYLVSFLSLLFNLRESRREIIIMYFIKQRRQLTSAVNIVKTKVRNQDIFTVHDPVKGQTTWSHHTQTYRWPFRCRVKHCGVLLQLASSKILTHLRNSCKNSHSLLVSGESQRTRALKAPKTVKM